jgi:hypothetical protein
MKTEDKISDDKTDRNVRSRTDQRYWMNCLKKRVRKVNGIKVTDPDFSVQISFGTKRERVKLATPNKSEAAARAASFYRSLVAGGWVEAYAKHEFSMAGKRTKPVDPDTTDQGPAHTLGALFAAYSKVSSPRASTLPAGDASLGRWLGG